MKQICRYSGILLQTNTLLNNLGLDRKKLLRAGEDIAFSLSIRDLVTAATFKPHEKMSTAQRHLLAVAMMKATGVVNIKFPISANVLTPEKAFRLFPVLIDICCRIAVHKEQWAELLSTPSTGIPSIEVRADNVEQIDFYSFFKEIIYPQTTLLLFHNTKNTILKKRKDELLADEIELEAEIKKNLREYRNDKRKYAYAPHMGKLVLAELEKILKHKEKVTLSASDKERAFYILTTRPEKYKPSITTGQLKSLREKIVKYVKVTLDADDTVLRSYLALTVGYLDGCIEHLSAINHLFGGITVKTKANLPGEYPVSDYVIKETVGNPFPTLTTSTPKNPNISKSTNPLVQAILAKRAAQQRGENTEESN